ncbi:aldo/keto reductase [Klebsiella pneumoniae subsp. pneumoniae]|nr:aldo/keto reductase [Klebsiella pneumoniae subsp. pneumoniae]
MTLLDTLEALTEFQRAGKIRRIGVSNETAFGVMRYLHLADKHDPPADRDYSESLQPAEPQL